MAIITVGGGSFISSSSLSGLQNFTSVDTTAPANDTGTINTFSCSFYVSNGTGVKIGTFYGSGTSYTNREFATIGTVAYGSIQTFSGLNVGVVTGDFIGTVYTAGSPYKSNAYTGSGRYAAYGDKFDGTTNTYYYQDLTALSFQGTGVTAGKNWQGITISKWNGIAISKINNI